MKAAICRRITPSWLGVGLMSYTLGFIGYLLLIVLYTGVRDQWEIMESTHYFLLSSYNIGFYAYCVLTKQVMRQMGQL